MKNKIEINAVRRFCQDCTGNKKNTMNNTDSAEHDTKDRRFRRSTHNVIPHKPLPGRSRLVGDDDYDDSPRRSRRRDRNGDRVADVAGAEAGGTDPKDTSLPERKRSGSRMKRVSRPKTEDDDLDEDLPGSSDADEEHVDKAENTPRIVARTDDADRAEEDSDEDSDDRDVGEAPDDGHARNGEPEEVQDEAAANDLNGEKQVGDAEAVSTAVDDGSKEGPVSVEAAGSVQSSVFNQADSAAPAETTELAVLCGVLEPLSPDEAQTLAKCEQVIAGGLSVFVKVGAALKEIRDNKLYRSRYGSFIEYVNNTLGKSRQWAHHTLRAFEARQNLMSNALDVSSASVRALSEVGREKKKDIQVELWREACALADGSPTEKDVKDARQTVAPEEPKAPKKFDAAKYVESLKSKLKEKWEACPEDARADFLDRLSSAIQDLSDGSNNPESEIVNPS